jgi:hypothetical protein
VNNEKGRGVRPILAFFAEEAKRERTFMAIAKNR